MATHWIYLEPYTFVFTKDSRVALYNTLNGQIMIYPRGVIVSQIIDRITQKDSGYGTFLEEDELADQSVVQFISDIELHHFGNVIELSPESKPPYILKPILRLINNPFEVGGENEYNVIGNTVIDYVNRLTIYAANSCKKECSLCNLYCKQTIFCTKTNYQYNLSEKDYIDLILKIGVVGIENITVVCGEITKDNLILRVFDKIKKIGLNLTIVINIKNINDLLIPIARKYEATLVILVSDNFDYAAIYEIHKKLTNLSVQWKFAITSIDEYNKIEKSIDNKISNIEVIPIYTGFNKQFFEDEIYLNEENILSMPIGRQTIYARQTLNELLFGQLIVMPDGMIFSNLNYPSLGSIKNESINKIVFNAVSQNSSWFLKRTDAPCNNCVYQYLCPSPSNYELVIGKPNLCHIKF